MDEIIVTDYGNVRLSKLTLAWLDTVDRDWRELLKANKWRTNRAQRFRWQFVRLEEAVGIAAAITWNAGGTLQEF